MKKKVRGEGSRGMCTNNEMGGGGGGQGGCEEVKFL